MEVLRLVSELHEGIQFFIVCSVYYLLKFLIWQLPKHAMRTIRVYARGWPPEHLDADGDWKPALEED